MSFALVQTGADVGLPAMLTDELIPTQSLIKVLLQALPQSLKRSVNLHVPSRFNTPKAPVVSHRKKVLLTPSWFDDENDIGSGGSFPLFGRTFHIGLPVSIRYDRIVNIRVKLRSFLSAVVRYP